MPLSSCLPKVTNQDMEGQAGRSLPAGARKGGSFSVAAARQCWRTTDRTTGGGSWNWNWNCEHDPSRLLQLLSPMLLLASNYLPEFGEGSHAVIPGAQQSSPFPFPRYVACASPRISLHGMAIDTYLPVPPSWYPSELTKVWNTL